MSSASRSEADVLLPDIEDSVQPVENKQAARDLLVKMVSAGAFKNHKVFPRINDRESGQLLKDIHQLTIDGIDGFMYPKAKTGQDVYFFDKLLETIEYEKGLPKGKFKIIPLIETAGAVLNAQEICQASDRVIAIAFGSEDFIGDLEGIHDKDSESLFAPRSIIAMAARANDVIPIDTVHIRVHDLEDLEQNIRLAKNMGYEGMLVLHPKEIELVHRYYSPTQQEVSDAKEMVKLSVEAEKEGKGVAIMNGKFIGPPLVLRAKKILAKQDLIDRKPKRVE
ncbi:MAG: CoA ester lyase [Melioribacteraceae bacterium]|nr:MAG: CoA ester lyase [Melioribacteraceae bacterium]